MLDMKGWQCPKCLGNNLDGDSTGVVLCRDCKYHTRTTDTHNPFIKVEHDG